jgi:hypothetical protein
MITTSAVIMVATPTIKPVAKNATKKRYNTYKNSIVVSA